MAKLELSVKIDKEEFEGALDKAFDKKKKTVKVDGFREGKVPKDVYLKKFGKESLYMDAIDILLPIAYNKLLDEQKVEPVAQPKVDIKSLDENGVEFSFVVVTKPDVKVKKYKGLGVKKQAVKVSKEEIEHELSHIIERYSEVKVKEKGAVENKNIAIIDFEGFKDKVPFEGGKGENYSLEIGSHTFIPGFEEQVIGMKKNEEKDINVTFPEDYQSSELAGKEVVFKVKVNEIKEKIDRELDKDFFEDLGMEGVDTKEKLEDEIKANIKAKKETDNENAYVDDLLKEITKNTEIEIPEEMIDDETEHMVERFSEQLQMQGVSLDVYLQMTRSTKEDLKKQMEEEALNHIKFRYVLEEIMNKENINVTEEEASKEAEDTAKKYNISKDEFLKMFGGIEMVKYDLEMRKTIDFLKENN